MWVINQARNLLGIDVKYWNEVPRFGGSICDRRPIGLPSLKTKQEHILSTSSLIFPYYQGDPIIFNEVLLP